LLNTFVELFVENVGEHYISHGEIIDGRANNMNEWKADIKEIMKAEFSEAIHCTSDNLETFHKLAIAQQNELTIALALVEFHPNTKVCILCDIIVDASLRKQKIGESMLNWIETEIKLWGAKFFLLESCINNQSAHNFFERAGFNTSSIVMIKEMK